MRQLITILTFICSTVISYAQPDSIILKLPKGAEKVQCRTLHIPYTETKELCFKYPGYDNEFIITKYINNDTSHVLKFYEATIAAYTNEYHTIKHEYKQKEDSLVSAYAIVQCTLKDEYYDSTSWFDLPDGSQSPYFSMFVVFRYKDDIVSIIAQTNEKAKRVHFMADWLKTLLTFFIPDE